MTAHLHHPRQHPARRPDPHREHGADGLDQPATQRDPSQIVAALDLIIQVERMRDGQRRITAISEVCGLEGDVITMNEVFNFEYAGDDLAGRMVGRYVTPRLRPGFLDRLRFFGLDQASAEALESA